MPAFSHSFVPASELKKQFRVEGHFYDLSVGTKQFKCRSVLEIKEKECHGEEFDFVVIMMNPGASRPLDSSYIPEVVTPTQIEKGLWKKELIPTVPDPTQHQIMRLMQTLGAHRVQVFNLCDLRNGNAQALKFDHSIAKECDSTCTFSITSPDRIIEVKERVSASKIERPLLGWGENLCLREYAEKALTIFPIHYGIPRKNPWFSHPSPMLKEYKLRWLDSIYHEIKKHNQSLLDNA